MSCTSFCILPALLVTLSSSAAMADASCEIGCGSYCRVAEPDLSCRACLGRCSSGTSGGGGRSYGAIAATTSTGDYFGYSYGKPSRASAEQAAIFSCEARAGRKGACEIGTWFYNQCAAIAIGSDGVWASDRAGDADEAASKALSECKEIDESADCKLAKSFCSR